jgi:hypothetical protein
MAVYRPIQISYWQDTFVINLTPEEKFFYLYLMTNSKTTQCGIFELPIVIMKIETGYNEETIKKLIDKFISYKKIKYDLETNTIFLINWLKYNQIDNVNVCKCVVNELKNTKNIFFIADFINSLDSLNRSNIYNLEMQAATKGLFKNNKGLLRNKQKQKQQQKQNHETETTTEIQTEDFEKFWDLYDKKIGDRKKIHIKFNKLKEEDRNKIFETLPEYVNSTPDKKFRKNPETYLNNCSWNDEIIQIKPHKIKDDLEPEKF